MSYILGINNVYHDSSACLLYEGKILAYAEEERLLRVKHAKYSIPQNTHILPTNSIEYCLSTAGINGSDIDTVAVSFLPERRKENRHADNYPILGEGYGSEVGEDLVQSALLRLPDDLKAILKNHDLKVEWIDHHVCHAHSAFSVSPFTEAAVLVVDGIAEFDTTLLGYADENGIRKIEALSYPNSVGFLWEKLAVFLGFSKYDAGKIMGLAAFGQVETFSKAFSQFVNFEKNIFSVDNKILKIRSDDFSLLESVFGIKKRKSCDVLLPEHADIAAGLQFITDKVVLGLANKLHSRLSVKTNNLCYAGGVALNCQSNAVLAETGPFKNLFIPPHCNDAGTSIGAAFAVASANIGSKTDDIKDRRNVVEKQVFSPYWLSGPEEDDIKSIIESSSHSFQLIDDAQLKIADLLANDEIVARYAGTSEIGPRALGNRSILAPANKFMVKDVINFNYKQREFFRPLAPMILREYLDEYFDVPFEFTPSMYYMLLSLKVKPDKMTIIPGAIHYDGSARVQVVDENINLPLYRMLRHYFEKTGRPVLINTSFNHQAPIVHSPQDALQTFEKIDAIKFMMMGNYLVSKTGGSVA